MPKIQKWRALKGFHSYFRGNTATCCQAGSVELLSKWKEVLKIQLAHQKWEAVGINIIHALWTNSDPGWIALVASSGPSGGYTEAVRTQFEPWGHLLSGHKDKEIYIYYGHKVKVKICPPKVQSAPNVLTGKEGGKGSIWAKPKSWRKLDRFQWGHERQRDCLKSQPTF